MQNERNPIREIALAAAKKGRVNVLEWARLKGFDFDAMAPIIGNGVYRSPTQSFAWPQRTATLMYWNGQNQTIWI